MREINYIDDTGEVRTITEFAQLPDGETVIDMEWCRTFNCLFVACAGGRIYSVTETGAVSQLDGV